NETPRLPCQHGLVKKIEILEAYPSCPFSFYQFLPCNPVDLTLPSLGTPPEIFDEPLQCLTNSIWKFENAHNINWNSPTDLIRISFPPVDRNFSVHIA